jgi:hypothetical protein
MARALPPRVTNVHTRLAIKLAGKAIRRGVTEKGMRTVKTTHVFLLFDLFLLRLSGIS